jgi:hypothetical protein
MAEDSWRTVCTVHGKSAETLAVLSYSIGLKEYPELAGHVALLRFNETSLFRIVVYGVDSRPFASFVLPIDAPWNLREPTILHGATVSKGLKLQLMLPPSEGIDSITLKIPYGKDAVLFGEALSFADQTVKKALLDG